MEVTTVPEKFSPSAISRAKDFPPRKPGIFLPKEHGSWSLVFEPLCLGLVIAPSWAGAALALTAAIGFFTRRPLKAVLGAATIEERHRALPALGFFVVTAVTALLEAGSLGGFAALWPLLAVAPLGGVFVYFDRQNDSRAAIAEIVGSSAYSLLPAAIATLAGWSPAQAMALSLIALTRSLPTVLTIRTYLRQNKGTPTSALPPLLLAGLAVLTIKSLHSAGLMPVAGVYAAAILLGRTIWLLSSFRPHWSARQAGQLEAVLGLFYISLIGAAYHLH